MKCKNRNSTVVDYFDTENFLNKLSNKTRYIISAGMTNIEKKIENKNKTKKLISN